MGAAGSRWRRSRSDALDGFSVDAGSGRFTTLLPSAPQVGEPLWHDRPYTVTSLGDFAAMQVVFVKACNDDKKRAATLPMWTIQAPCAVTVYLNFWGGLNHELLSESWLKSPTSAWERTHMEGVTFAERSEGKGAGPKSSGPGSVYMQTFPAGPVEILGQDGDREPREHGLVLAFLEYGWGAEPEPLAGCAVRSCSHRRTTLEPAVPLIGDEVWHDQRCTFASLGHFAGREMAFVRGSNDDKTCAPQQAMWTLEAARAVTVYLDFWGGAAHERIYEHWLRSPESGWELTGMTGTTLVAEEEDLRARALEYVGQMACLYTGAEDMDMECGDRLFGPGRVYKQTFPAGQIEILGKGRCNHGTVLVFLEQA